MRSSYGLRLLRGRGGLEAGAPHSFRDVTPTQVASISRDDSAGATGGGPGRKPQVPGVNERKAPDGRGNRRAAVRETVLAKTALPTLPGGLNSRQHIRRALRDRPEIPLFDE